MRGTLVSRARLWSLSYCRAKHDFRPLLSPQIDDTAWFPSQTAVRKTFIHGKRLELVVVGWDIKEGFLEKVTWSLVSTVEQKEFPLVGEAEGIRMRGEDMQRRDRGELTARGLQSVEQALFLSVGSLESSARAF